MLQIKDIKKLLNSNPDKYIEAINTMSIDDLKQICFMAYALNVSNSQFKDSSKKIWKEIIARD